METIITFVRQFFILSLILILVSYLVPRDGYRRYLQFFAGVFMAVIILQPVAAFLTGDSLSVLYEDFAELEERMADLEYEAEHGKTIYELFTMGEMEE